MKEVLNVLEQSNKILKYVAKYGKVPIGGEEFPNVECAFDQICNNDVVIDKIKHGKVDFGGGDAKLLLENLHARLEVARKDAVNNRQHYNSMIETYGLALKEVESSLSLLKEPK